MQPPISGKLKESDSIVGTACCDERPTVCSQNVERLKAAKPGAEVVDLMICRDQVSVLSYAENLKRTGPKAAHKQVIVIAY